MLKREKLSFLTSSQKGYSRVSAEAFLSFVKVKTLMLFKYCYWREKKNSKANEKITKVKEDRDFLSRYLIARPRPSLVPELDRCIGEYEMSSVPRSLCETNGSLLIPTDK